MWTLIIMYIFLGGHYQPESVVVSGFETKARCEEAEIKVRRTSDNWTQFQFIGCVKVSK